MGMTWHGWHGMRKKPEGGGGANYFVRQCLAGICLPVLCVRACVSGGGNGPVSVSREACE